MTVLLDSGVIATGDGVAVGLGLVALFAAAFALPVAFRLCWGLLRSLVLGTSGGDEGEDDY